MKRILLISLLLCSCVRVAPLSKMYDARVSSTVTIYGDRNDDFSNEIRGVGSGFFVDERHVLTNAHVANSIIDGTAELRLLNGKTVKVKRVAVNDHYDLALFRAESEYDGPVFNLETDPEIGSKVFVIGSPSLFAGTLTTGILSRKTTTYDKWSWDCEVYLIDACILGGSSGSPVFDMDDGIVGMVSGGNGGMTVIIPSFSICAFLREHGV